MRNAVFRVLAGLISASFTAIFVWVVAVTPFTSRGFWRTVLGGLFIMGFAALMGVFALTGRPHLPLPKIDEPEDEAEDSREPNL